MDIGNSNDGVNVNAGLYAMFDVFVFGLCHCEVPTEVWEGATVSLLVEREVCAIARSNVEVPVTTFT